MFRVLDFGFWVYTVLVLAQDVAYSRIKELCLSFDLICLSACFMIVLLGFFNIFGSLARGAGVEGK